MVERLSSVEATVLVDTVSDGNSQLSQAYFMWPDIQPSESYTIQVNNLLAIDFDAQMPVRPLRARWLDLFSDESALQPISIINQLLPQRTLGMYVTHTVLNPDTRLQLALIQAQDEHTPPLLRAVCKVIIARSTNQTLANGLPK